MVKLLAFLIVAAFSLSIFGQDRGSSFSWDLSYESLLKKNNVDANELIQVWLKKTKSPAEAWVNEIKTRSPVSAIMIEHPAFHAAERTTLLLFRTETEAFYWEFVEGGRWGRSEEPVKLQQFEAVLKEVSAWMQLLPKSADELPDHAIPGYMGFLSYFDSTTSRQMLLSFNDFLICPEKNCEFGKVKPGRVMAALEPILIPEEVKNYRHRPEVEIAEMSVEERINEKIREYTHFSDFDDRHGDVIEKYLRQDGRKTFPQLIKLMDGYIPRRLRDSSSFVATQIAADIDENVVRLRGSAEGRQVIEAMKRLNARMEAEAGTGSGVELDLQRLTGTNFKDQAIADALWLRHRINMSETELLKFTEYLIKTAPDYPSWSETEWVDIKRTETSAFKHTQGAIVKESLRYYQSYLAFKRTSRLKK